MAGNPFKSKIESEAFEKVYDGGHKDKLPTTVCKLTLIYTSENHGFYGISFLGIFESGDFLVMYGMDAKHAEVSHFHPHLIVQLWQGQHEMISFNSPIINLDLIGKSTSKQFDEV